MPSQPSISSIRRVILGVAVGGSAGLALSSLFIAKPEGCFVGRWRIAESSSFPKAGTLDLLSDGNARLTEFQDAPYRAVWKSRNDILEISLVSRRRPDLEGPEEEDPDISWRLEWKIADRAADSFKLEGPIHGNWPKGSVTLVRE